jgi:undecaprenyl diphosphate synthase
MTASPAMPKHVAIIMDGNGRWAKKRFLPRLAGHRAGVEAARRVVKHSLQRGVKVLSLFAFSSENWQRPAMEVSGLMEIFLSGLEREVHQLHEHGVKLRFIGRRDRLSEKLCEKMQAVETLTQANTAMVLIIAVDYGGQWDICESVRQIAKSIEASQLKSDEITQDLIAKHLSFADLPDPDLFIRTSGELRISNFMLWQLAYAELFFTEKPWPDFDEATYDLALEAFAARERRYGGITLKETAC